MEKFTEHITHENVKRNINKALNRLILYKILKYAALGVTIGAIALLLL